MSRKRFLHDLDPLQKEPAMRRRIATAGLLATLVASAALPAMAGGWWTYPQLDEPIPALGIGDTTTVTAQVLFTSTDEADAVQTAGGYYAYLVRGIDIVGLDEAMRQANPGDWWTTPQETILLGQLTLGPNDSNLSNATVTFVVPEVAPGGYDLMLCNQGCSVPLADVVPLQSIYVGDPATVRLMRDNTFASEDVSGELRGMESRLDQLSATTVTTEDGVDDLSGRVDTVVAAMERMETSLSAERTRPDVGGDTSTGWLAWAGWFLAGIAAAVAWANRRLRRADHTTATDREHVPAVRIEEGSRPVEREFADRS